MFAQAGGKTVCLMLVCMYAYIDVGFMFVCIHILVCMRVCVYGGVKCVGKGRFH